MKSKERAGYEAKLAQARADQAHLTAAIKIFEATDDPDAMRLCR